jgi:hypothetical protein
MKNTVGIGILLSIMSLFALPATAQQTATFNLTQSTGTISCLGNQYGNNMNWTWNINISESNKPVSFSYTIDIEYGCDYVYIYAVNADSSLTLVTTLTGSQNGTVSTAVTTGKAKVVFTSSAYSSYPSGYLGINITFSPDYSIGSSYLFGNSIINGKLGVGYLVPKEKVHINGSIRGNLTGGALNVKTDYGYMQIGAQNSSFAHLNTDRGSFLFNKPIQLTTGTLSSYSSNLSLNTTGTTRMTILNSNGYVGIGTTAPTQALSLKGGLAISPTTVTSDEACNGSLMITKPTTSGQYINLVRAGNWSWSIGTVYNKNAFAIGNANQTDASFTSPAFVIDTVGRVGIGTTTPESRLQVNGEITMSGRLGMWLNSTGGYFTYDNKTMGHYSLGWFSDTWSSDYGPALWTSAWGGMKFFTEGTPRLTIDHAGNVGIGTVNPIYPLDVKGTIRATEIKVVSVDQFADFVLDPAYQLPKLQDVHDYIQTNGHLPEIPSAKEVKENGMSLVDMQVKLLQKVEELTLYAIDQQKRIEEQSQTVSNQQKRIEQLEQLLKERIH